MRFMAAAHTDIGVSKKINQDAFCLKIAKCGRKNIAFAVLCDGMGGLNSGEYASALVVNAFSNWFENEFPLVVEKTKDLNDVVSRWSEIVQDQGKKILAYGKNNGISLGTTLVACLIVDNMLVAIHVGDSRLYRFNTSYQQLTVDQTVAEFEISHKRMTKEQAKTDRRSNVLLQCVGASTVIEPQIIKETVNENDVFMLCSDGFRHKVTDQEIFGVVAPSVLTSETIMKKSLVDLIELNKIRKENDNITAIVLKAIK